MKKISLLSMLRLALLLALANCSYVYGQKIYDVPVDLETPMAPTPVKADGKLHLLYELHITSFRAQNLELTRVEVFKDSTNILLASYKDAALTSRLARPGAPSDLPDKRVIGGGMRAVVFLQITVETESSVPKTLRHRLFFKADVPNDARNTRSAAADKLLMSGRESFSGAFL
jgi:hypothetical protein